jgi:hypothetical protein
MKIELLKRYGPKFGGNSFNAFFGYHEFHYGGTVTKSVHLWPFYIEWGAQ